MLEPHTPLGMTPASFDGAGAVGINFFNAAALYGQVSYNLACSMKWN